MRLDAYQPQVLGPALHVMDTYTQHLGVAQPPCSLSSLTLAVAVRGHAVPTVAVFAPEGPHCIDAAPFCTHVWPQALINICKKQKTQSGFISQNTTTNFSHLPGQFEFENEVT